VIAALVWKAGMLAQAVPAALIPAIATVVQVAPGTFVQFAGAFAGGITGTWLSHARAIRRHEAACPGHAARNSPGTKEQ